jgi:hypothetical protein
MSRSENLVLLPEPSANTCVLHLYDKNYTLRLVEEQRTVGDGVVVTSEHENEHPVTTIVCSDISIREFGVAVRDISYKTFSVEFYNLHPPRPSNTPVRVEVELMRPWQPKTLLLMLVELIRKKTPPIITCNISHTGKVDFFDGFLAHYECIDVSRVDIRNMAAKSPYLPYCFGGDGQEYKY